MDSADGIFHAGLSILEFVCTGRLREGATAPVPGCKGKKKDCAMTCASIRNYNKVAEMAIFKLPKTQAKELWRGVNLPKNVLANMKKDMKFSDAALLSTTTKKKLATKGIGGSLPPKQLLHLVPPQGGQFRGADIAAFTTHPK